MGVLVGFWLVWHAIYHRRTYTNMTQASKTPVIVFFSGSFWWAWRFFVWFFGMVSENVTLLNGWLVTNPTFGDNKGHFDWINLFNLKKLGVIAFMTSPTASDFFFVLKLATRWNLELGMGGKKHQRRWIFHDFICWLKSKQPTYWPGGVPPFGQRFLRVQKPVAPSFYEAWNGVNLTPARCKQFLQDGPQKR